MNKPASDWDIQLQVQPATHVESTPELKSTRSMAEAFFPYAKLPRWLTGPNVPAFPISILETADTVTKLLFRSFQVKQAIQGLTNTYRIQGITSVGRDFLYNQKSKTKRVTSLVQLSTLLQPASSLSFLSGILETVVEGTASAVQPPISTPPGALTKLSLDDPDQFTISWTTFPEVFQKALPLRDIWKLTMTSADEASRQFWPMIAEHGLAYNLLILEKVDVTDIAELRSVFASVWSPNYNMAFDAGLLYAIDQRRFEMLEPQTVDGDTRFTPASLVLLIQDPATKALTPVAIRISARRAGVQIYCREHGTSDSAWMYALMAAKTSITVYGIWIGHVYHWHIVTAAMVMTMIDNLSESHPVFQILKPQSKYLIGFNNVLMLNWDAIAPPTSIISAKQFLDLINQYADGRGFFADDPLATLQQLGLSSADFTIDQPWDKFLIVARMLAVWNACTTYVSAVMHQSYATDAQVVADTELQAWISASSNPDRGNVQGLPTMNTRAALINVVASLIYRVTVHGSARLNSIANPAMTFVANFPPCLQNAHIPKPDQNFDTKTLLGYLPMTGTIGNMVNFYYAFAFSTPYEPFIPFEGIDDSDTLFYGPSPTEPRNLALIAFRNTILKLLGEFDEGLPQRFQWPLNIET